MKKKIDIQLRSARLKVHKNHFIVAKRCFVVLQKILGKVSISLLGKKKNHHFASVRAKFSYRVSNKT